MTNGERSEILNGLDQALRHARDAERCGLKVMATDRKGPAQQTWEAIQRTIRALELARKSLRAKIDA